MPCPLPQAVLHTALRKAIQRLGSGQGLGSRLSTMVGNAPVFKQLFWLQGAGAEAHKQCAPAPAPCPPRRGQPSMRQHWQITDERPAPALAP